MSSAAQTETRNTVAELGERLTWAEYVAWKGYFRAKQQLEKAG